MPVVGSMVCSQQLLDLCFGDGHGGIPLGEGANSSIGRVPARTAAFARLQVLSRSEMPRKILVTSALPYANGSIHLGHLVEYIQTDIWVRFQKMQGHEVHYVCADDTHGTPVMLRADKEGIAPEELIARVYKEHTRDFAGFHVAVRQLLHDQLAREPGLLQRHLHAAAEPRTSSRGARSSSSTTRSRRCSCPTASSRASAPTAIPRISTATPARCAARPTARPI